MKERSNLYLSLNRQQMVEVIIWSIIPTKNNKERFAIYCENVLIGKSALCAYKDAKDAEL